MAHDCTFLYDFWEFWRHFIFPKKHQCCFCLGIKSFVWIARAKTTCIYKLSVFLRQRWRCSLKQVHLFEWREYPVKEWQADIHLLMSLILCDKIWQSNWMGQFVMILWNPFTHRIHAFNCCLKCLSFLKDFLGKIPTKLPLLFSRLSALPYIHEITFLFNILPRSICVFRNILEIRRAVKKKL